MACCAALRGEASGFCGSIFPWHPPKQEPLRFEITCVRATVRQSHLLELIHLQLERLRITRGVVGVLVRVIATAPFDVSQPDLFGDENLSRRRPKGPRHAPESAQ